MPALRPRPVRCAKHRSVPAAGTRASPMALAASSRLVLVTPSPMTLVTASCKAAGLAAGRESCRVRPPVSEPLRPHRRSAGGGLCRSPRIGAPCLISCPRRSFRLYMSVFINYQYGNMSIAKASHPARTLIGRFRPLRGQLWTPVRMNRIPTSKYLIQYIYSRKSGQISARKGKFTLFAGFYRGRRLPEGAAGGVAVASCAGSLSCLRRLEPAVDAALELAVEGDGLVVGEGQELGQEHSGDALMRVEPVIGVENSAPGDAGGTAAVGPGLRCHHVAEAPFARHAREEVEIVCELRVE